MKFSSDDEYQLERWITKQLEELHQSSPDTLAKYIVSLLKEEKTDYELISHCEEELKPFLKTKSGAFVGKLFDAITGKCGCGKHCCFLINLCLMYR